MLVLSRKKGERIVIGRDIVVTIVEVRGDRVRLAFDAPPHISIHRQEIHDRIVAEAAAATPVTEPDNSVFYPECA